MGKWLVHFVPLKKKLQRMAALVIMKNMRGDTLL